IGNGDGFIFGRKSLDGDDRTKALFNNRGFVGGALVQHGWRIEKAIFVFWSTPVATDAKTCTGFNAAIDIVGDFIAVLSRDQWSGFGFVIERPTHNNVAGTAHQFIDELFCDGVLNDQTGTGGADESRIKEAGIQRIVQCSFEVCISKDHVGILAAKFQRYVLDGVGGGFGDLPTGDWPPGEGHQIDVLVGRKWCTNGAAVTQHHVGNPGWQAELVHDIYDQHGGVRGKFCWFDHKRVAGGNCRSDLPGRLQQWEVPRCDHADHTDRFMYDTRDDRGITGIDKTAGVMVCDLAEVT